MKRDSNTQRSCDTQDRYYAQAHSKQHVPASAQEIQASES